MSSYKFPRDFVWGVATSSYQIEGAHDVDGRKPSIWDTFSHTAGKVANGDTGDVACEHYYRWENDLDLIRDLGVNAYRFSVAWPRVLPDGTGQVNQKGLDFYDRLVDGMLERGLEPYCTLYHWDLPQVLEDAGGWTNRDTAYAFAEYADVVTKHLGDRVVSYATLNEPWCSAYLGYMNGHHAPGHKDAKMSHQATHNLLLAHGLACPRIRANAPKADLGIVLNLMQIYPETDSAEDMAAAVRMDSVHNLFYLDPMFKGNYPQELLDNWGDTAPVIQDGDLNIINAPLDYIGLNYYTPAFIKHGGDAWPQLADVERPGKEQTDMGWEVYAQGLSDMLERLSRDYGLPVYVMENGAAYPGDEVVDGEVHDPGRVSYYERHVKATQSAIENGADVRGYFAWSLMDNFEWAFGYDKRFGIVYVDFETQKRTLKDSAKWYRNLVLEQRKQLVDAAD